MCFIADIDLSCTDSSIIICFAVYCFGNPLLRCIGRIFTEIQEGLRAVIDDVFCRARKVGCVFVRIVRVCPVVPRFFGEEEFIILICEYRYVTCAIDIRVAVIIPDNRVRMDQEDCLYNIKLRIVAFECFACRFAASGITQKTDSVRINIGKRYRVTNCIIQTAALNQPLRIRKHC